MKAKVRAEIRRQIDGGVAVPHVDLELLRTLGDR
jgi:hypothetical protein